VVLRIVNSGQHFDANMFGNFFVELNVPQATDNLGVVMQNPADQVAEIMRRAATPLTEFRPDVVCVFGDTNSSLAFGLTAVKLHMPLVHIEAGCRSHDMSMPEEVNRRIIDHISGLLLAVSELGATNARSERVPGDVSVVGDPLYDVYSRVRLASANGDRQVEMYGIKGSLGLMTLHRPSNVDDPQNLRDILGQLGEASDRSGLDWVFPVHPRTRRSLPAQIPTSVRLVEPLPYTSLLDLLHSARVCVTDSGGLQKEALWARVPCVTIRPNTEWMETVWQRANVLAPLGSDIAGTIAYSLDHAESVDFSNPYGDGRSSERVVRAIHDWCRQRAVSR
jgi:UDP-N-acetylglucosamine 2-epimerase